MACALCRWCLKIKKFIICWSTVTLLFHYFDLFWHCLRMYKWFVQCLGSCWQDFHWFTKSRGPSAATELFLYIFPVDLQKSTSFLWPSPRPLPGGFAPELYRPSFPQISLDEQKGSIHSGGYAADVDKYSVFHSIPLAPLSGHIDGRQLMRILLARQHYPTNVGPTCWLACPVVHYCFTFWCSLLWLFCRYNNRAHLSTRDGRCNTIILHWTAPKHGRCPECRAGRKPEIKTKY